MANNSKPKKIRLYSPQPIPPHYIHAATILRGIHEKTENLQNLAKLRINHYGINVHDSVLLALAHGKEIDYLIEKYHLLHGVIPINPWCTRILIAEVLWGKQRLGYQVTAHEITAIRHFEETLRESFPELLTVIKNPVYTNRVKIPTYLRINTLSISLDNSIAAFYKEGWRILPSCNTYQEHLSVVSNLSGHSFIKDYHIPDLLVFPPGTSFYDHPGYLRGKFLIQDKGSCLSSFLLNPKPNSAVLDMCAAPGLKLNHLANIMGDTGVIYATDYHYDRWTSLVNLLERTNVTCARTVNAEYQKESFENNLVKYIILDHTTTNSGLSYYVFATGKTTPLTMKRASMTKLYDALQFALHKYPNVKRVVFTTCTIYAEEAEMVVDKVLNTIGDCYSLLDVREMLWNQWGSMGYPGYLCSSKCLRTSPEVDNCYCYFIAVFERNFNVPLPHYEHHIDRNTEEINQDEGIDSEIEEIPSETSINMKTNSDTSVYCTNGDKHPANKNLRKIRKRGFYHKKFRKQVNAMRGQGPVAQTLKPKQTTSATPVSLMSLRPVYNTTHSQLYP